MGGGRINDHPRKYGEVGKCATKLFLEEAIGISASLCIRNKGERVEFKKKLQGSYD